MDIPSGGACTLVENGGIQASINYNPGIFTFLQNDVDQYLEDISARKKFLALPGF
jgi:hypothetical protein